MSKALGIVSYEQSWDNVKKIKSDKIYDISCDVSEKYIIFNISACIELSIIDQTHYDTKLNDFSPSHVWNKYDEVLDHRLENELSKGFSR